MHLFYAPEIHADLAVLDAEESRHLSKVLRLEAGEPVKLIDGKGYEYQGEVSLPHPKKAQIKILSKNLSHSDFGIRLAVAPTKNLSRWEWFLEKATELGIDRISPLVGFHSERKVLKRERQERILLAAMKQSYKSKMPELDELQSLDQFLKEEVAGEKFIAYCGTEEDRKALKSLHEKKQNCTILIGPEGDFSPEEVQKAKAAGYQVISLGESRLRTETAAIIALHSIHLLNE